MGNCMPFMIVLLVIAGFVILYLFTRIVILKDGIIDGVKEADLLADLQEKLSRVTQAIVGGEKLKYRTFDLWLKKFGVRIFEGYGTTETSPVIAVNTPMFYKEGSVGRLLPRIDYRLQEIDGITDGKRLEIKGDNVMLGYMLNQKPNVLQKASQWYDTGDIVTIDENGFISIKGRAKRFAKIGGEMISLTAVEQILDTLYPETKQGIVAIDDEKKGEKLIFVTSAKNADTADIRKYFQEQGLSELWMPREVVYMPNPPLLGSGKFDYQTAAEILR